MPAPRRYWLLKSEPDVFSFDDLLAAPKRRTLWDGVRNYQARNLLRDEIAVGDGVLYYHSSCDAVGIAGVARVVGAGTPDPTQFDPADDHHDPKSDPDDPRWFAVEVEAVEPARHFLSLSELRATPGLQGMAVLRKGQRLSVQPVTQEEWRTCVKALGLARKVRW